MTLLPCPVAALLRRRTCIGSTAAKPPTKRLTGRLHEKTCNARPRLLFFPLQILCHHRFFYQGGSAGVSVTRCCLWLLAHPAHVADSLQRKGRLAVCAGRVQANEHPFSSGYKGQPPAPRHCPPPPCSRFSLKRKSPHSAAAAPAKASAPADSSDNADSLGSSSAHVNEPGASTKTVVAAAAPDSGLSALLDYDDSDD